MSKVTAKYQITIPPGVREELGILPGTEVDIRKQGQQYILVVDSVAELQKKWRGKFKNRQTTDEYINQIRGEIT